MLMCSEPLLLMLLMDFSKNFPPLKFLYLRNNWKNKDSILDKVLIGKTSNNLELHPYFLLYVVTKELRRVFKALVLEKTKFLQGDS